MTDLDKVTEMREIIARIKKNHTIATHKDGFSWPTTPLEAVNYFTTGSFAEDSWRLVELVDWLDSFGHIDCEHNSKGVQIGNGNTQHIKFT